MSTTPEQPAAPVEMDMPTKPPVVSDTDDKGASSSTGGEKFKLDKLDLKAAQEKIEGMAWVLKVVGEKILKFLYLSLPHVFELIKRIHAYYIQLPAQAAQFLVGFVFCFYGGTFPTLFAAIEAAEQGGRKEVQAAVIELAEEAWYIIQENEKDNQLDEDKNGIRDVLEISKEELFRRKTKLVLTKLHPEKIDNALYKMYKVWLTVAAVLKIKFARVISFSLSIAEFLEKPAKRFVEPVIRAAVPNEYEKWVPVLMSWAIKSFSMSIAWYLQTIYSAIQSAVKGALLMSRAAYDYAKEKDWEIVRPLPGDHQDTYVDEALSVVFAVWGFSKQFGNSFDIPFPWSIFFFPFTVAEYWIRWTITSR